MLKFPKRSKNCETNKYMYTERELYIYMYIGKVMHLCTTLFSL